MNYYTYHPMNTVYYNRDAAAEDIADLFYYEDDARDAFYARCDLLTDDGYTPDEIEATKDDEATFNEWATYKAYDLLDAAEKNGRSDMYGVTVYADPETEALEERITDMIDPWCDDECRVATFCDLYNATDTVSDIIEYIVNELDSPESFDEAAARVRLIDDIRAYRKARREKVSA